VGRVGPVDRSARDGGKRGVWLAKRVGWDAGDGAAHGACEGDGVASGAKLGSEIRGAN
jgi:hypothetical protein